MTLSRPLAAVCAAIVLAGCAGDRATPTYPTIGHIERLDSRIDAVVPKDAVIEQLADGFDWSEGPVWVAKDRALLFSDVPRNVVHRWRAGEPVSVHLKPSGYTGATPRGGEPGSNGLTLDAQGRLVLCEHGDRRVARLEADGKTKTTLADRWQGKRLNSPNDLVYAKNGDLYFTDPPYGLEGNVKNPAKELDFQGVYRLSAAGELSLITKELSRPNGIALSPDERTLYVANSDPARAIYMAYERRADGTIGAGRVLLDTTALVKGRKGLPDGLKVATNGILFATGPGGVLVITPTGNHLGTIVTGQATANCAWGDDGATLYITADMWLCRIKVSAKGW